jgi:hypothetical protein
MITGQDEEAARKWDEYQQRNRSAKPEGRQGEVQCPQVIEDLVALTGIEPGFAAFSCFL